MKSLDGRFREVKVSVALGRLNNVNLQSLLKVSQIWKRVRIILYFQEEVVKNLNFCFPTKTSKLRSQCCLPKHFIEVARLISALQHLDKLAGKFKFSQLLPGSAK